MRRVFVPRDSAAVAVGAEAVAAALATLADVEIVRTGSRGMAWLEPLVEVETAAGRIGYGPLAVGDVPELLAAGLLDGGEHRLRVGRPEDHPWLAGQTRLIFARCGVTDPLSLADYRAHGGFAGLARARAIGPAATIEAVTASGLRGRGGAGFPTGIKWRTVAEAPGAAKYVVCNADEGDSGTFADRMVMEGDPFLLIEGMAIAAHAVGAAKGLVYSRSEYPRANRVFADALEAARGSRPARRVRDRTARRRRRLCLRRGDLAAGESRGQARPGAGQAAAAGAPRLPGRADGGQQCAQPGGDAVDPGARGGGLRRARRRPLARDPADPARRQCEATGPLRSPVRTDARRSSCTTSAGGPRAAGR